MFWIQLVKNLSHIREKYLLSGFYETIVRAATLDLIVSYPIFSLLYSWYNTHLFQIQYKIFN
nr:hypothetical protein BAR15_180030 [Bartonella sp. AR 15-3]